MQQGSILGTLFPLIIFFAIFYFLVIRPQQNQAKAHKNMLDNLAKGDKIITNGGIKCTVVKTDNDFITVKLNDSVMVELDRQFVARKIDKTTTPTENQTENKKQNKKSENANA